MADRAQHLLLPTLVLVLINAAFFSRIQRNLMLDSLGSTSSAPRGRRAYGRAGRVMKHALRTSLIPTGTYFAFSVATLFIGATFMEIIFSFHGMGEYGVTTISGQDVNGAVAVAAFSGACVLVGAILSDIMVAILDPRVRSAEVTMSDKMIEVADETTARADCVGRRPHRPAADQPPTSDPAPIPRNKTAIVGLIIIIALIILALIGPYLTQWTYDEVDRRGLPEAAERREHLLGTTQSGRDMLALTLRGLRKSLLIGFLVAIISTGDRRHRRAPSPPTSAAGSSGSGCGWSICCW